MALTTQQFQDWLESNSTKRCILVETTANILGIETPIYISNANYITGPSDTPANITYTPIVKTSLSFNQAISLEGAASLSYGDIAIDNTNGSIDEWLSYIWSNRPINIYIGSPFFSRADFTKIYSGFISDIASSDRNTLNLSIRDVLQSMNTPITSVVLGGTGQNKEQLRPLVFGEVHNITPVQFNAATLTYMVHNGPIEKIIEIRDNGVPLTLGTSYTEDLSVGTFTLLVAPIGTITASVQGEKTTVSTLGALVPGTYTNTVAKLIELICLKYGTQPLIASNLDLTTFNTFDTLNPAPVGIYLTTSTNLINVCQELARTLGAHFTSNRNGLVTILKVIEPSVVDVSKYITDSDILVDSLSIEQKVPVQGAFKIGYCKNWTIQDALLTGIPEAHKIIFAQEYLTTTASDTAVLSNYLLSAEPNIKNTSLISNTLITYASLEANRLLSLWKVPRFVFRMECTSKFLTVSLGEMVSITHSRFGLYMGKYGQVISISTDWDTGRVTLGILV
jgi:hypothetical protein